MATEGRLEAAIWDMDGVIADTGRYHRLAWQDIFAKRGASFTEADFNRHFGQRNDTIIRDTLGQDISQKELDAVAEAKEARYRQRIAGHITALPGAVALLRALGASGIKVGLASSAPWENIIIILRGLLIEDCFQAIVYGREVAEGKPSPQIYLKAAARLGVPPANCAVIEDAVAGVAGAKKAGMKCLAVTNSHPRESLSEADRIVDTLEGIGPADLAGLFRPATG